MKKLPIAAVPVIMMLAAAGCGHPINNALPEEPLEFCAGTFCNPDNPSDTFLSVEYGGRTYIPYGVLKEAIDGDDVGACLGYYVQDGEKMEDVRFFLLNADPDANFLVRMQIGGEMTQPDFFRAVDTKGRDVRIPRCIDSADEESFWQ